MSVISAPPVIPAPLETTCQLTAPSVLDSWSLDGRGDSVAIRADVTGVDLPERIDNEYGEFWARRLRLTGVAVIAPLGGVAAPDEVVLLNQSVREPNRPVTVIDADELVGAADAILIAYTDSQDRAFVVSVALADEVGEIRFLGPCASGLDETLTAMMGELLPTDDRTERDVLIEWLGKNVST